MENLEQSFTKKQGTVEMSKLQRQEDEMYAASYTIEMRLCRTCKHYHGQIYQGVELVCAVHPYGYSGDTCLDRQVKQRRSKN